jgi:hypothetical protein
MIEKIEQYIVATEMSFAQVMHSYRYCTDIDIAI